MGQSNQISLRSGEYSIDVFIDLTYSPGSADNVRSYDIEHLFKGENESWQQSIGTQVTGPNNFQRSAILPSMFGVSAIAESDILLVCNGEFVICLSIPDLKLKWQRAPDWTVCFDIMPFCGDYIVHGELEIFRVDRDGKVKWQYYGDDIFVCPDGQDAIVTDGDHINVTDWNSKTVRLDQNGNAVR